MLARPDACWSWLADDAPASVTPIRDADYGTLRLCGLALRRQLARLVGAIADVNSGRMGDAER